MVSILATNARIKTLNRKYRYFNLQSMKSIFTIIGVLIAALLVAQRPILIQETFNWTDAPIVHNPTGNAEKKIWTFEDAYSNPKHYSLPLYSKRFRLSGAGSLNVTIKDAKFEQFDKTASSDDAYLKETLQIRTTIEKDRNQYYGKVFFIPVVKKGNQYEKLVNVSLAIDYIPQENSQARPRGTEHTFNSVLSDGLIYKIAIDKTGLYRLDYNFLKEELSIDIDNIDPTTIKIYGNGGGLLPQTIADFRYDDLQENAIQIVGEEDGRFDTNDYMLFYAEGPHKWRFNEREQLFNRELNIYDNNNFYFIKIGGETGKRIANQGSIPNTNFTTNSFNDFFRFEEELINLLDDFTFGQGTGKIWYGDLFETIRERNYAEFSFPNIIPTEEANIKVAFAGRSNTNTAYTASVGNRQFSANIRRSNTGDIEDEYAHIGLINGSFLPESEEITVSINYPQTASSVGWLDYIQINARRELSYTGGQMSFRDIKTLDFPTSTFQLSNAANSTVWDVSNPLAPLNQQYDLVGNQLSFGVNTNSLKEFIVFDNATEFFVPEAIGLIPNQNIHQISSADVLIIYPKEFENAAFQLAEHRRNHSGFEVQTVLIDEIYNEFASGRLEPTAIRDFVKMVFDRSSKFNYLLLFGDGSFDFKNIKRLENPSGFIPVFETDESLHPIEGFPTDDYYALLSDNEGANLRGALDIAVGRIPVKTPEEAQAVVNKIINYETNPKSLGDWRLRQSFMADDEDNSIHQRQANDISTKVDTLYDVYNVNKIYLDAFQQITTPGGQRYPAAKEALNNDIFKGILVLNYLGHGGSKGWTQERVLETNDILGWTNFDKLPLLVTATCSFTGYDDPNFVTAGEHALLNPVGGAVGLFTTVRAVYSSSNERLTKAVFNQLYEKVNGVHPPIGELMRLGKNSNSSDTTGINSRKFTLIGDPSMQLALPKFDIVTTSINGAAIESNRIDTIQALEKVTVEGYVSDAQGNPLTSFNGKIFPTVFDKKTSVSNLGNDIGSRILSFDIQKNVLFKGVASVVNGRFQFTFVVPRDINYQFGFGKISYYAEDGRTDAAGYYNNLIIGGTKPDAAIDNEGPLVEVFINDSTFVFGGTTGPNPTLLVSLSDENGINVSGTSIGHDLTAVLDNNTQNTLLLNDFYEAAQDDHTRGIVRFPLGDIEEGTHQIRVKAWDVFNNSSEGITEFVIASSQEAALERVLNYPNPFTTNTQFQFLHNIGAGQLMEVQVRIFTVSGRLIKTIDADIVSDGISVNGIEWDGRDDFGGELARGTYLYKVSVRPSNNSGIGAEIHSDFEKLVILK